MKRGIEQLTPWLVGWVVFNGMVLVFRPDQMPGFWGGVFRGLWIGVNIAMVMVVVKRLVLPPGSR